MVNKSDSFLKLLLLEEGTDKEYNKAWKRSFFDYNDKPLKDFKEAHGKEISRVCKNLCVSQWKRFVRIRERTRKYVLSGQGVFATFTFTDEALKATSAKTRRRYVSWACKAFTDEYVANIDFGAKNGREHYHAILKVPEGLKVIVRPVRKDKGRLLNVPFLLNEDGTCAPLSSLPCFDKWREKMGFIDLVCIGKDEADCKRSSRYTAKMTNHAIKSSTCVNGLPPRLIYSRKVAKCI